MNTLKEAFESGKLVPYNDILTGKITENSFAVGFHAVLNGTADKIYSDPAISVVEKLIHLLVYTIPKSGQRGLDEY